MTSEEVPDWLRAGWPHIWLPYTQMATADMPPAAVATKGTRIMLSDGRTLIDGMASWWTAVHGYNHPHILAAMMDQLQRMPHVMFGGLGHEPAFTLARRLAALAPGKLNRVFFSDSGSVAIEVALKMALQYHYNRGESRRIKFIAFRHGYHGDTTGAMAVTDPDEGMHRLFRDLLPQHLFIDLPSDPDGVERFSALLKAESESIAGIILEPLVQGAGGMKFHDVETVRTIADYARHHGALFIADEIFTGFGRTGSMFACEPARVVPDIMCVGKGLTGGTIGLAATIATEAVFDAFLDPKDTRALMHGPTYMANPLACAAANASLDLFEREDRLAQSRTIETWLADGLAPCRDLPGVEDVRVKGAIGVVQFRRLSDVAALRHQFVDEGVWIRPFGNIVYLTPALTATQEDIASLTGAMLKVLSARTAPTS
jgi:adenosylmethionine-8-amino-7-oxononanoate aminotransferase